MSVVRKIDSNSVLEWMNGIESFERDIKVNSIAQSTIIMLTYLSRGRFDLYISFGGGGGGEMLTIWAPSSVAAYAGETRTEQQNQSL